MNQQAIAAMLGSLMDDKGIPKNIKTTVEESLAILEADFSPEEKICNLISILDEISNDPNVSAYARTQIWSVVSALESFHL